MPSVVNTGTTGKVKDDLHSKAISLDAQGLLFCVVFSKRIILLVLFLILLACLSGYLLSKASFIGRLGITFFYKHYLFLKTWWKTASVIFIIWMILLAIQAIIEKKLPKPKALIVNLIFILLAIAGLFLTYSDFQHTTTHRWLKERFHLGAYLFWLRTIIISIFFMVQRRPQNQTPP